MEEVSELKIELAREQYVAEECDKKARQAKNECEEVRKKLAKSEEKVQRIVRYNYLSI